MGRSAVAEPDEWKRSETGAAAPAAAVVCLFFGLSAVSFCSVDERLYLFNVGTTAAWVDGLYQALLLTILSAKMHDRLSYFRP